MKIHLTTGVKSPRRENDMFGHHAFSMGGVHVDAWGNGPLLMRYKGREWWFEFSRMFGPQLIRKTNKQPADRQPMTETHPFWVPFNLWMSGGEKCRPIRGKRKGDYRVRYWLCHVPKAGLP